MRLIDVIKTIKTKKDSSNFIIIQSSLLGTYFSRVDLTRNKKDSIRIPLEELNIEYIFPLPGFMFVDDIILWVTEDCEYFILYSQSKDNTTILDIQELKEQDESYLVLKYGKFLLEEI